MKKYLVGFGVLVLVSICITCLKEKQSQECSANWEMAAIYHIFSWPEGVTVWALFLTLVAVAEETQETAKAARATEDAVITANESLELQRDIAKRQLRAYICVEAMEVLFRRGQPVAVVTFKNTGQTPAYDVHGWMALDVKVYPMTVALPVPTNPGIGHPKLTLGTDATVEYEQGLSRTLPDEEIRILGTQNGTVVAYGQLRYKDTFGDEWYTSYRLIAGGYLGAKVIPPTDGRTRWYLKPDVEGNTAT